MRKKINKGLAFILIGALLLMGALGWFFYNRYEDRMAGKSADEIRTQYDKTSATVENDIPLILVEGDAFCGKLTIPSLGLELPIFYEWDDAHLKKSPCRYSGQAVSDDLIIAGHNYLSHFGRLNQLHVNDEVLFSDAGGNVHRFSVKEMVTLEGTAVSDMVAGDWDLTLFTCTGNREKRITVRCMRVSS